MYIEAYTEKCIVVRGKFEPHIQTLTALRGKPVDYGGKMGYMFPKTKEAIVRNTLNITSPSAPSTKGSFGGAPAGRSEQKGQSVQPVYTQVQSVPVLNRDASDIPETEDSVGGRLVRKGGATPAPQQAPRSSHPSVDVVSFLERLEKKLDTLLSKVESNETKIDKILEMISTLTTDDQYPSLAEQEELDGPEVLAVEITDST
jgi:hypothetical protein